MYSLAGGYLQGRLNSIGGPGQSNALRPLLACANM